MGIFEEYERSQWEERMISEYPEIVMDNLLEELSFKNLMDVWENGKKNMFEQILRDRIRFDAGHNLI